MHEELVFKIQLVTSSGLNLAEIPENDDPTQSQLSGGIMSAILKFSKEVHNQDIQSMAYFDRNIAFIPMGEILIILEVNSSLEMNLLNSFIALIRKNATPLFVDIDSSKLDTGTAQLLLCQIYDAPWFHQYLEDLGATKSLLDADTVAYKINNDSGQSNYRSIDQGKQIGILDGITKMVYNKAQTGKLSDENTCGFLYHPTTDEASFVISLKGETHTEVGVLTVKADKKEILFRMTPYLTKVSMDAALHKEFQLNNLLEDLKNVFDIDPTEILDKIQSPVELGSLDKKVKNVDKLLFSLVTGKQIVIAGDKSDVTSFIDHLLIFRQHLITDLEYYLQDGQVLESDIIGMSLEYCEQLSDSGKINENVIIVDLKSKKIKGKVNSNKFLKNLYERSRSLPFQQAKEVIFRELNLLISYAITATSYAIKAKNETMDALQQLKKSIADTDQYEIIQTLATNQNRWLSAIVYDTAFDSDWI